jgi:signal transduction histidine kinase
MLVARTSEELGVPRSALVWTGLGRRGYQLAQFDASNGALQMASYPTGRLSEPAGAEYLIANAGTRSPSVSMIRDGVVHTGCALPVNETLLSVLRPSTAVCWVLEGHDWMGLLLALDKAGPTFEDVRRGRPLVRSGISQLDDFYAREEEHRSASAGERDRIARDLHDGVLQTLSALNLQIESLRRTAENDPVGVATKIEQLARTVADAHDELRAHIAELRRDASIDESFDVDLAPRLRALATRAHDHWGLNLSVRTGPASLLLPAGFAHHAYWLIHEAIVNVARHAGASRCRVDLVRSAQDLDIVIADNGKGLRFHGNYDAGGLTRMNAAPQSVRGRIVLLGGALLVESGAGGTILRIRLPIPQRV